MLWLLLHFGKTLNSFSAPVYSGLPSTHLFAMYSLILSPLQDFQDVFASVTTLSFIVCSWKYWNFLYLFGVTFVATWPRTRLQVKSFSLQWQSHWFTHHMIIFGALPWEDDLGCAACKLILDLDCHQKYLSSNKYTDIIKSLGSL